MVMLQHNLDFAGAWGRRQALRNRCELHARANVTVTTGFERLEIAAFIWVSGP